MIFLQNRQQLSSGNKSASFYSSCTRLRFEVLLVHLHLNLAQSKQNLSLLEYILNKPVIIVPRTAPEISVVKKDSIIILVLNILLYNKMTNTF
ncbi:hypothetical protein GCM10012288_20800 [Malaciobacter pacificus]|nr:hypothetical protein GCM10012288_20800 [Malaciobacter pacificus]